MSPYHSVGQVYTARTESLFLVSICSLFVLFLTQPLFVRAHLPVISSLAAPPPLSLSPTPPTPLEQAAGAQQGAGGVGVSAQQAAALQRSFQEFMEQQRSKQ
jgi:hypothetical protein